MTEDELQRARDDAVVEYRIQQRRRRLDTQEQVAFWIPAVLVGALLAWGVITVIIALL